jgi:hypothetical protein
MSNRNVSRLFIHGEQSNHWKGYTVRPAWNGGGHGPVDAVSFLSVGHVFTANLTGNIVLLAFCIGYRGDVLEHSFQPFALIALTAPAMGTRNAAVRKLAIPDLTTTVLTLTITGIGADPSLANGTDPRLARWVEAVAAMFLVAALGAVVIHYSISAALWLATQSPLRAVQRCFSLCARPITFDRETIPRLFCHMSRGSYLLQRPI